MGDRTQITVRFYDVPENDALRVEIMQLLDYVGVQPETYAYEQMPFDEHCYDPEASVGITEQVADALDEFIKRTGTEFAYYLAEAPKFEWLGAVHAYVPGIGRFDDDSTDDDGQVVLNYDQIMELARRSFDLDAFVGLLKARTGGAVIDKIEELNQR